MITDLRAELEQHVPPMHGIKLVQDLQELKDTDQIKGEVQAITVPMIEEAMNSLVRAFLNCGKEHEQAKVPPNLNLAPK